MAMFLSRVALGAPLATAGLAEQPDVEAPPGFETITPQAAKADLLEILGDALLHEPKRPLVAILGGAKVADKLGVIDSLLQVADTLIIGGGMAYTFFKAMGLEIGQSLLDAERVD